MANAQALRQRALGRSASLLHGRKEAELHELADGLEVLRFRFLRILGTSFRNVALPCAFLFLVALRQLGLVSLERSDRVVVGLLAVPEVAKRRHLGAELLPTRS